MRKNWSFFPRKPRGRFQPQKCDVQFPLCLWPIFGLFKQFYDKQMWKMICPVSSAGIQNHNLLDMRLVSWPLNLSCRPITSKILKLYLVAVKLAELSFEQKSTQLRIGTVMYIHELFVRLFSWLIGIRFLETYLIKICAELWDIFPGDKFSSYFITYDLHIPHNYR